MLDHTRLVNHYVHAYILGMHTTMRWDNYVYHSQTPSFKYDGTYIVGNFTVVQSCIRLHMLQGMHAGSLPTY